jgi:hypothetical protein
MGKLHEILAIDADKANVANKMLEEASVTFTKRQDHFQGNSVKTEYLAEDRQKENTSSSKEIVTTVDDKLSFTLSKVGQHYDVLLQKELANQKAVADLVVRGVVLAKDVPATFLLGMETRLKALRTVIAAIPTLEPAIRWESDDSIGKGVFRSDEKATSKTEKDVQFKVLYAATKEHPANIEKWSKDVTVALIKTIHFSGMWTVLHKSDVLDRIDEVSQSVKQARMRANLVDVEAVKIADTLFQFVLSGSTS